MLWATRLAGVLWPLASQTKKALHPFLISHWGYVSVAFNLENLVLRTYAAPFGHLDKAVQRIAPTCEVAPAKGQISSFTVTQQVISTVDVRFCSGGHSKNHHTGK